MQLRQRSARLVLSGVILLAFAGLLALASAWRGAPQNRVAFRTVTFGRDAAGKPILNVQGEGLHGGLRAMLIPDQYSSGLSQAAAVVSGKYFQLAVDGQLVVATTDDHRFLTLDVTPGEPARILGSFKLFPDRFATSMTYTVSTVALAGSRALISRNNIGLILIDVSDPQYPREIDRFEQIGNLNDLVDAGGVYYAVGRTAGLMEITVEGDRLRVRRLGRGQGALRLAVAGRRLVTAGSAGDLALYDDDSRGEKRSVGTLALRQELRDLALIGEMLYLATADGRLLAYSTAAWPRLVQVGELALNGLPLRLEAAREHGLLFCSMSGKGVAVINVRVAAKPQLAGVLNMPRPPSAMQFRNGRLFMAGADGFRVLSLEEVRNHPFAASESFRLFDLSQGTVHLLSRRGRLFAYNKRVLVQFGDDGSTVAGRGGNGGEAFLALPAFEGVRLHALRDGIPEIRPSVTIPVSDPFLKEERDFAADLVRAADWHGGRLLVLSATQLQIFDTTAAGAGSPLAVHQGQGVMLAMARVAQDMVVLAYRGAERCGLEVVDVSVPTSPRTVGEVSLPKHQWAVGEIRALLSDGNRLYVSRSRLGVEIYDLSDPAKPLLVQRIDTPGDAGRLSLHNGLLAVSDQDEGVFLIDIMGEVGVPVGSYRSPIIAHEVLYDGRQLLVTNAVGGISRLPLPLRLVPKVTGSGRSLELPVPETLPPGGYTLSLYDEDISAEWPVAIPAAAPPAQNL